MMDTGASIRISYWAEQKEHMSLYDLAGIEEFKKELGDHYVSVVHGRPGDLGGLRQLVVEFISSISLSDVATFLAQRCRL
jgi:hypothetical protein